jgi:hypothetical protein
MMIVAGLVAALLAGDVVAWTAGLRFENRTRAGTPGQPQSPLPLELSLDPNLGLLGTDDALKGSLEYQPHLGVQQVDGRQQATVLHRLAMTGELRVDRRTRFELDERFSLGRNNFTPLASAATGPPDPRVPQQAFVATYLQQAGDVRLERISSPGTRLGASVGYLADGGVDAPSRRLIPLLQGPRAGAFTSTSTSRQDTIGAAVDAAFAVSTGGSRTVIAGASGSFEHVFDRLLRSGLKLGAAAVGGNASPAQVLPIATLSLEGSVPLKGQALSGSLRFAAQPSPDRYTGGAYERAELAASGDFHPNAALGFNARASGGAVVSGPGRGQSVGQVELSGTVAAVRGVGFTAGCRVAWAQPVAGQPGGAVWAAFAVAQLATTGVF